MERRNKVWCHLALTLDATTLMQMRHDCVGDEGIGDRAKACKFLQERFKSVQMPTVVTIVAQLARLQLEVSDDLDSFFIRGQELFTSLLEAGESISETLFNPWSSMVCQWGMKVLLCKKASTRQRTSQSWEKGCRTSMRTQDRDTRDKVFQWHWRWSVTLRRAPRKETALCFGSLGTLPRIAGGRRQQNAAIPVRRVTWRRHARDNEMEANMSKWQLV